MGSFSLGYQVLLAAILGAVTGIFFGPLTEALGPIGSAYTMLLQMAVLPYITFSLIHGLGSITPETGKKLLRSGWPYLLTLWALIFILIYLLAALLPNSLSPIIQSDGADRIAAEFTSNFLNNLIPQNPFYDIMNNVVPAVAVFALISGIALMHVENKEPLISSLERINQTIEKILKWLGIISPIGVYAYLSIGFGTIHFEDLAKIQIYILGFVCATGFLVFWILPTLLSTLTPLSYREALRAFRYVCLLPFVTGLSTAALPFLNSYLKKLSQKHETHAHFRETSQTILPIAYSFGHIGNAMTLFFIFFLSYYYRHPFNGLEKTLISILTVPLSVGASSGNLNSILFLIKQLGFPEGATQFFLQIKPFTFNLQVLMSIASVLTLILLAIYAYYGLIQVKWKQLVTRLATPLVAFALFVFGSKSLIHPKDIYDNLYMNLELSEVIKTPVHAEFVQEETNGAPRSFNNTVIPEVFKQVLNTRILKVGFYPNSIPYCYYNNKGQLVGFDTSYAYELASDLGCDLQFVQIHNVDNLASDLRDGIFDIAMSSIIMSEERLLEMEFTFPYLQDNNVLVVRRTNKKPFLHLKGVQELKNIKIGAAGAHFEIAKRTFPNATVIKILDIEPFLKGELDALVWAGTTAMIWCLSHPEYVAIDYGDAIGISYFAYPIREHAIDFGFFLNSWLILKENSGFKNDMKSYWLNGIPPGGRTPRWSILHNVLKWNN